MAGLIGLIVLQGARAIRCAGHTQTNPAGDGLVRATLHANGSVGRSYGLGVPLKVGDEAL